jgi:chromosomal replication initiator protein
LLDTALLPQPLALAIPGPWPVTNDVLGDEYAAGNQALRQARMTANDFVQNYLFGHENQLLAATLQGWLDGPINPLSLSNPLVLVGPPAAGKSHLLWGMSRLLTKQCGSANSIICLTGQEFLTTLNQAQERDKLAAWQTRLRQARFLLLDNLTQLANRTRALQELRFILDEIMSNGGQVLLTTRLSPELLAGMTPQLLSRLEAGLVVNIQSLSVATRTQLWQRFAAIQGLTIAADALSLVTQQLKSNAVEIWQYLEDALVNLEPNREINLAYAKELLQVNRVTGQPNLKSMATIAAKYAGLKLADLQSASRRRSIVTTRNLVIYLARQLGNVSLEQLGKFFGGRDHTTVLHGYRTIEEKLATDLQLRKTYDDLRQLFVPNLNGMH